MPGPRTDLGAKGKPVLAIRWIFPNLAGASTVLTGGIQVIGRSTECSVVLESDQVSRRHAEIRREGLVFLMRDLGSRNGIYLDGIRTVEGALSIGVLIRVGEWLGVVVQTNAGQTDEPEAFHEVVPGYWAGRTLWPTLRPLAGAARTKVPIVIEGETGTGKEGVAKAIHLWSNRQGKLVAVNCAAIPENLAEGELFGYRKGAFTGADRAHQGYLRAADGGTLFLDEVADLPLSLQPKLLRALEQGETTPIGQSVSVAIDVRLVAAIQRPLADAVQEKRFRPDLYARLDGVAVRLPTLRERIDEVPFLFCQLLKNHAGHQPTPTIETPLVEALCLYDWPYNVRELDRVVQHVVALFGSEPTLTRAHLPEKIRAGRRSADPSFSAVPKPSPELALSVLSEEGCNVRRTADRLLISRQQLYRLLETIPDFDLETFRKQTQNRRMDTPDETP
jgi:transcriptional regulator with AAA-type ATPase domain